MNQGMIGFFNIRERRATRNMGVDKTAHRRVINGLTLPKNHRFEDEAHLYRAFVDGILAIPGTTRVPGEDWISSKFGSFYTKLVVYKNITKFNEDPVRHLFPLSTATTPSTAVREIPTYLKSSSKPICFFIGQQNELNRDSDGHCWSVFVWKEENERKMVVRDSNSGSYAKISEWTRDIARQLKIPTIKLVPASIEDRSSEGQCVDLTYTAIADFLDGNFNPIGEHEDQRFLNVSTNKYLDQPSRKRKASGPINIPAKKVLREIN
jgi:hypothetical protein